jgi:hypothetical protein
MLPKSVGSCIAVVAILTAPARAQGVRILEQPALGTFPTLQAAVDAASPNNVLIVAPGAYASVTIDNKSLWIEALQPGSVTVNGTIEVKNLGVARRVVLVGLKAIGAQTATQSQPALRATSDLGQLRIDRCDFTGGGGSTAGNCLPYGAAGHGAELTGCNRVTLVRSTLRGGKGGGTGSGNYACNGGRAGDGVRAQGSTVALYDSTCIGGVGGAAGEQGGRGGDGYHALDFGLFASNTAFDGGDGGLAWDYLSADGGDGGHGLDLDGAAQAQLLDCVYFGSVGGESLVDPIYAGAPGNPTAGAGIFNYQAQAARVFDAAPIASDGANWVITVLGSPGDRAYLLTCSAAAYTILHPTIGILLVADAPKMHRIPLGTIPMSGSLTAQVALGNVVAPTLGQLTYAQGVVATASGARAFGSPLHLLTLDRAAAPDCNGNAAFDYLDLIEGTAADCQHDFELDVCQIASGIAADCNANAVPDSCDIAGGGSEDLDFDGVPDECQASIPGGPDWYVDDSAAPGGNGSAGAPFQTIWEAVLPAVSGDRIHVADGLYTGSGNKNLDFDTRRLEVSSVNGPGNCIVDLQNSGRILRAVNTSAAGSRIAGLTIRNGNAFYGGAVYTTVTLDCAGCVFENCITSGYGGAIYVGGGSMSIADCVFRNNQQTSGAAGGAIALSSSGTPNVVRCLFEGNASANLGGALWSACSGVVGPTVALCTFRGNSAGSGAAVAESGALNIHTTTTLNQCLLVGNTAVGAGGAIWKTGTLVVANCTLAGNSAGSYAGAITCGNGSCRIDDSILWANTSANGSQLAIYNAPTTLEVQYSDAGTGAGAVYRFNGAQPGQITWGAQSFALDPFFLDPDGADNIASTLADNDYRLAPNSPCIDAGDNSRVPADTLDVDGDLNVLEPTPLDHEFAPRFVDTPGVVDTGAGVAPIVDIGASERHP